MAKYILITESALDAALTSEGFCDDTILPNIGGAIHKIELSQEIIGYRVNTESQDLYFSLVEIDCLTRLKRDGGAGGDVFRRIARVVKGLKSPPVHLPRQWSEFHHRNLLAFFALPREISNARWVVDLNNQSRCAYFSFLTSHNSEIDLTRFNPPEWPTGMDGLLKTLLSTTITQKNVNAPVAFAQEIDLHVIGSGSVVSGRTYEEWDGYLTDTQRKIINNQIDNRIRIVGPAGSGKTLSLCMRVVKISRDDSVIAQGKRILVATHSWAMAERIDGILQMLNGGSPPSGVIVFPLLSLLEMHAGHIGNQKTDIIGDDSTDGRNKALDIIKSIISKIDPYLHTNVSHWVSDALRSLPDSRVRLDLVINLYEELTGVLTASGVAPDDPESIQEYMNAVREDWMPPFPSVFDRSFVISVYKLFIQNLIDRSAITTDQFILDSIRVLETFAWRMRKETEGYDYILVDELQLFDNQERSALELLGRSRKGVPFITAEDPSQGVFSALNAARGKIENQPVYLETVHRFNKEIFEFISFVYHKFPLNALPIKMDSKKSHGKGRPELIICNNARDAILKAADTATGFLESSRQNERICLVALGDGDVEVAEELENRRMQVTRLGSFDDVEQLSYSKRSIVASPWQFVGGAQFAHVVILAIGVHAPTSQFSHLREMISVYLSCSRASETLTIICSGYVPNILSDAKESGLLVS